MFKLKWIKENHFVFAILLVIIFALTWSGPGKFIEKSGWISPLTFLLMFLSGLGLPFQRIKGGFKDYKNILYCFLSVFLVFPLMTYILFTLFHISGDLYVGAIILSVQSSTLASAIVLTMSVNGDVPLALIVTIINNISSAFISPLLLRFILSTEKDIAFNVQGMIVKLIIILILPVVLAQILRIYVKEYTPKFNPYRKVLSRFVILLFILTGASTAASQLLSNLNQIFLVILLVVIMHLIMVSLALIYSRLTGIGNEKRSAVIFCSSQKTLPAGLLIWNNYFSGYLMAPIIIVSYHVMQLIIDSVIVNVLNKRGGSNKVEKG